MPGKDKIVFTNGCFDLIHPGHVKLLRTARAFGTRLIVGLNSDRSVRAIKGEPRPFLNQAARRAVLEELRSVDAVEIFDENTPYNLIVRLKPDVLVKGGDWSVEQIIGADYVLENGGQVHSIPFESDFSTSKIVELVKNSAGAPESLPETTDDSEASLALIIKKSLESRIETYVDLLEKESANVLRCRDIISEVAAAGGEIVFCGAGGAARAARNLADNFRARFRANRPPIRHVDLDGESFGRSETREFVLIAVGFGDGTEKTAAALMCAGRSGGRTIVLSADGERKIRALSDAGVSIGGGAAAHLSEAASAVGNVWCEALDAGN